MQFCSASIRVDQPKKNPICDLQDCSMAGQSEDSLQQCTLDQQSRCQSTTENELCSFVCAHFCPYCAHCWVKSSPLSWLVKCNHPIYALELPCSEFIKRLATCQSTTHLWSHSAARLPINSDQSLYSAAEMRWDEALVRKSRVCTSPSLYIACCSIKQTKTCFGQILNLPTHWLLLSPHPANPIPSALFSSQLAW